MVNLKGGIDKLPPAERLKRLRELEAEKRLALEEELAKKKEFEELTAQTKKELEETEDLEEETLLEMRDQEQLEKRLEEFKRSKQFVPEKEAGEAPGFGQQGLYQAQVAAEQNIDYLLHGSNIALEREREIKHDIYQNVRQMREQLGQGVQVEESYAFNKMQEQVERLKQRGSDDFGYITRIENVLNDIIDYRQQEEKRRKR